MAKQQSKFRNVFGNPAKETYQNISPASGALDSNFIKGSVLYFAFPWATGGGGALAVIEYANLGKLRSVPLIAGHSGAIMDFDWNPFNDSMIATGSEDCTVKVWDVPQGGLKENLEVPLLSLNEHTRKIVTVDFCPIASVLATTSFDCTIKIWDLEMGKPRFTVDDLPNVQSLSWAFDGSKVAAFCKDKMLRVLDPRNGKKTCKEVLAHQGTKGGRVVWLGSTNKILTTGFSKSAERQYCIWDPAKLSEPLATTNVDQSSGVLMPFYDEDSSLLFLAGKGDGNIRYFDVTNSDPYLNYITDFKSNVPQKGIAVLPKRVCDSSKCEVVRLLKLTTNCVEPINFTVPRRSEQFQDDLYPNTFSGIPTVSVEDYFKGKSGPPRSAPFPRPGGPTTSTRAFVLDRHPSNSSDNLSRTSSTTDGAGPSTSFLRTSSTTNDDLPRGSPINNNRTSPTGDSSTGKIKDRVKAFNTGSPSDVADESSSTGRSSFAKLKAQHDGGSPAQPIRPQSPPEAKELRKVERENAELRARLQALESEKRVVEEEKEGLAQKVEALEEESRAERADHESALRNVKSELEMEREERRKEVERLENDLQKARQSGGGGGGGGKTYSANDENVMRWARGTAEYTELQKVKKTEQEFAVQLKKKEEENVTRLRQLKIDIATKDAQIKMLVERLATSDAKSTPFMDNRR
mmetsp:Transcript_32075/g.51830  ORF Transcript_32075/g.51830 Transcript_32075/m.51830 type:complete len:689 (+) Transcript_32075:178-2244(+)|eukprot:CAMPEP_0184651988 /NCGR_PEP_ID=MMETSP0308-20130426/9657_1 /TAXON_ID=38269 /ORGANISM="Gloeochaete witrockiana, Strain SAG 46.84" /LENGTH=688 /DNA_ID=CAMNT_0027086585 /DNA_START=93 /DNA_END=2159 /DNA_ORIENTATION=+